MNLLNNIINDLEENKAIDIVSIDVTKKTSMTDYLVFATGTSNRHIGSMSHSVYTKLKKLSITRSRIEGNNNSGWIIIDSGDVIVHLFKKESRKFYNLEKMWSIEIE